MPITWPVQVNGSWGDTMCCPVLASPPHAVLGKDCVKLDMEIKLPHMELLLPQAEPKKPPKKTTQKSDLSGVLTTKRSPEPVYFQAFDCIGIHAFLSSGECGKIIDAAEKQGFSVQRRHQMQNMHWADIVDPLFAEAIWRQCGLDQLLQNMVVDGMVPCGLNDVIRIQKYAPGGMLGRHIDQHVKRVDGRTSLYSLRVFLNGDGKFQGGLSAFHVPFRAEPVVFEPEAGMALMYPQGELCTVQEECEVVSGNKYVLRADILFQSRGRGAAAAAR